MITINLDEVNTIKDLHSLLKKTLNFPAFYGNNWDAFWDAITGLVAIEEDIFLQGWESFYRRFPNDASILLGMIKNYNSSIYRKGKFLK